MQSPNEYKRLFYAVGLIGIILCFVPASLKIVSWPSGEEFSEMYILGPNQLAENYPFNVSAGESYRVYLGVGNHMGSSMYYGVEVKFGNGSEQLPNDTVPSSLPAVYEYRVFLGDGQVWENPLTFSFSDVFNITQNTNFVGRLSINNVESEVNKTVVWDNASNCFYYQLIVELWRYNQTSDSLLYDGRFVSLWLNITSNG
jgi:hypothetical protein